jgi:hypothetical protein
MLLFENICIADGNSKYCFLVVPSVLCETTAEKCIYAYDFTCNKHIAKQCLIQPTWWVMI